MRTRSGGKYLKYGTAQWAAALAPSGVPYSGFKKEPILYHCYAGAVLTMIQHI